MSRTQAWRWWEGWCSGPILFPRHIKCSVSTVRAHLMGKGQLPKHKGSAGSWGWHPFQEAESEQESSLLQPALIPHLQRVCGPARPLHPKRSAVLSIRRIGVGLFGGHSSALCLALADHRILKPWDGQGAAGVTSSPSPAWGRIRPVPNPSRQTPCPTSAPHNTVTPDRPRHHPCP